MCAETRLLPRDIAQGICAAADYQIQYIRWLKRLTPVRGRAEKADGHRPGTHESGTREIYFERGNAPVRSGFLDTPITLSTSVVHTRGDWPHMRDSRLMAKRSRPEWHPRVRAARRRGNAACRLPCRGATRRSPGTTADTPATRGQAPPVAPQQRMATAGGGAGPDRFRIAKRANYNHGFPAGRRISAAGDFPGLRSRQTPSRRLGSHGNGTWTRRCHPTEIAPRPSWCASSRPP